MKTSLVTTLSVVGILATGGGAFAANTKVLDSVISSVQGPPAMAEAIVPFADLSIESTTIDGIVAVDTTVLDSTASSVPTDTSVPATDLLVGPTTSVVATVTPTTTVAPVPGATVAPVPGASIAFASVQSTYNIPGVGIITLKQDATSLKIVSVNPVSGWTFDAENKYATRVEVGFKNGNKSVKFRAELLGGRVIAAVSVDDDVDDDETYDAAEKAAKEAADAAEKAAKEAYDAAEKAAKEAYDAAEKAAKAAADAAEIAAKATYDAAEKAAKEANDEVAVKAAKEAYEAALKTAKAAYEAALKTAKAAYETDDD